MKRCLVLLLLCVCLFSASAQQRCAVSPGAEQMQRYLPLLHGPVAVVCNQTSVVKNRHLVDTLRSQGVEVARIFCPEHGFRGEAAAGAHVDDETDAVTGIAITSLYGNAKKPTLESLKGISVVLFDLQDVGCRFYTYISTLHYVMEACAENGVPLVVLDRPNPNAHYVDGPVLEPKWSSFVGMHPVPVVYGMTIGEYALMVNGEGWLKDGQRCNLKVVAIANYTHATPYTLPVNPSPNLRTPQAIALYPSLCLFEGTHISVGRGTDYPFEVIGNSYKLDLRQVTPPNRFSLEYLIDEYRHTPKGKFFLKNNFFEKLAGNASLRQQIEKGLSEEEIRATWEPALSQFKQIRSQYLLYP